MISDLQYEEIVRFLRNYKIHNGNLSLNKTLHNHPKLNQLLLDYEKKYILDIEREFNLVEDD